MKGLLEKIQYNGKISFSIGFSESYKSLILKYLEKRKDDINYCLVFKWSYLVSSKFCPLTFFKLFADCLI